MTAVKKKLSDTSLFRQIYITDLFFCMVSFLQVIAYVLLVFLFIWGIVLVYRNQRRYDTLFKLRFGLWISAFLIFSVVSILLNFSVTLPLSLLMLLHVIMCFFAFYGMHTEPEFNHKLELFKIARLFLVLTTLLSIIGIVALLFGFQYDWSFYDIYWIKFPVYENRLTGVYYNPNLLGFVSVAGIFCAHVLSKEQLYTELNRQPIGKLTLAICAAVNLFSLILSDSNAAFVLMIAYCVVYLSYIIFDERRRLTASKVFIKIVTFLLVSAIFIGSAMLFRSIFKTGFAAITARTNSIVEVLVDDSKIISDVGGETPEAEQPKKEGVTFKHINKNLDSGRFKLWRESLDLFKISPVFGIANGNIVFYSEEYLNGILQYGYHNNDLHNGFLTIIVSTGIIGALLFGTFGFRFAKHVIQHLYLRRKSFRNDVYPCLFSFLAGYLPYAFFERALLYDISFLVLWFWLIMGYMSCFVAKFEPMLEQQYLFHRERLTRTLL